MGAVGSIDNCYKDVCCPKDLKLLEENKKENLSYNKEKDNNIISNISVKYDKDIDNLNHQKQIFFFEHDDYNIYNNNNDEKIEEHNYENTNLENIQFYENNFKNELELINENNNILESSPNSGLNSSNFSFKCFVKNSKKDNHLNNKPIFNKSIEKNNIIKNKFNKKYNNKHYINSITKIKQIQRIYRKYLKRKKISEQKTSFEEEEENDKNIDNQNFQNYQFKKVKSDLILNKIKCSKNYSAILLNRYLIDIDFIDVSEESFRSVTIKSNKLQEIEPPQFSTLRDYDNDQVKGYFLLKKKLFKYQGQKDVDGKKIGFGRIFWEDSSKLKGYFRNSKLNGIAYFYNFGNEISTFYGEYRENIPFGYGIYSRKGYIIEGNNWVKNILNGIGVAIWDEGEMYEGEFKNSVKEGIGLYRWADGTSYVGEFKKNKITGFGKMSFSNGNSYEGQFKEGFLSGWGKFIWDDGKYYIGNYLKDKKHGFGIFVWSLEPLIALIGFWNQGKQSGVVVKLFKGICKIIFTSDSRSIIEINSRYEISKYLLPSQAKYKNFFKKKKYNDYVKFINFASKC